MGGGSGDMRLAQSDQNASQTSVIAKTFSKVRIGSRPRCGIVFVGDVARKTEIGDCPEDEAVVQLLRFVDFVAPGNAARVEVANQG